LQVEWKTAVIVQIRNDCAFLQES